MNFIRLVRRIVEKDTKVPNATTFTFPVVVSVEARARARARARRDGRALNFDRTAARATARGGDARRRRREASERESFPWFSLSYEGT